MQRLFMFFFSLLLFINISLAQSNSNQIAKLTVLDADDKSPIHDAHVNIATSTTVLLTDKNGNLEINANKIIGKDLLLTHISYEATIVFIELGQQLTDTIYMNKQSVKIEDVVVKSKSSKKKKTWLKRFKRDVFGTRKKSKHIDIQNEEDILFSEKSDSLMAYGNDIIEFENKYLGYKVKFLLNKYVSNESKTKVNNYSSARDLRFKGTAWFEDTAVDNKKIENRRTKLWATSIQVFLQSLLTGTAKESGFSTSSFTDNIYKTNLDGIYATIVAQHSSIKSKKGRSDIYAENQLIIFNNYGEILNKAETQLSGYWKSLTLTDLMPSNYREPVSESSIIKFDRVYTIGELRAIIDQRNKSKDRPIHIDAIELMSDKQFYLSNETAYVTASLLDINLNSLVEEQQLIYFEVYDNKSKNIIQKKCGLTINGKASQSFILDKKYDTGQYSILAYTDHMTNFSSKNFGQYSFVVNLKHDDIDNKKYIEWYPEGNNLLIDQTNKVAFKVTDAQGKPTDLDDQLLDRSTNKSIRLKTLIDGLGTVQITPSETSEYYFKGDLEMLNELLPAHLATITLLNTNNEHVSIKINAADSIEGNMIKIYQKGNEVFAIENPSIEQVYKIKRSFLPKGNLSVRLIDDNNDPISSRQFSNDLIYNKAIVIKPEFAYFYNQQKGTINIDIDSILLPDLSELSWSVAIRHEDKVADKPIVVDLDKGLDRTAIKYLTDLRSITSSETKDWDYNMVPSLDKDVDREGIFIKLNGTLIDLKSDLPIKGKVNVSSLEKDFYFDETKTDKNGRFNFEKLPFRPDASYIIQGRKNGKNDTAFKDKNVRIEFDSLDTSVSIDSFESIALYKNNQKFSWLIDTTKINSEYEMSSVIDEVTIKAKSEKFDPSSLPLINGREWHNPKARVQNVMSKLFPKMDLRKDLDNPFWKKARIKAPNEGGFILVNFYISVDGFLTRDIDVLDRYSAEDIAYIGYSGGTVYITTSPIARYKRIVTERSKGVTVYSYDHLLKKTEFDPTLYNKIADESDTRTTLYWNPDYKLSSTEENEIEFVSSDVTGDYIITMTCHHPESGKIEVHKMFSVLDKDQ